MHARNSRAEAAYLLPVTLSPAEERMRALNLAAAEAHQAALGRAFRRAAHLIGGALLGWVRRARVRAELASMTEHELADMGLTRGDIDRVVGAAEPAPQAPEPRRPARPAGIPVPHPA